MPARLRSYFVLPAFAALSLTGTGMPATAQTPTIAMEEFMVPSTDAGIQVYVRNKRPADMTQFRAERTVLFVHGAT